MLNHRRGSISIDIARAESIVLEALSRTRRYVESPEISMEKKNTQVRDSNQLRHDRETFGKRARVWSSVIRSHDGHDISQSLGRSNWENEYHYGAVFSREYLVTYDKAYRETTTRKSLAGFREALSHIKLSLKVSEAMDPELHPALQDLADEINWDLHEACFAFNDPDLYYPGVPYGIEPVTDEHVDKVIVALQRELDRELRQYPGHPDWQYVLGGAGTTRPSAPLNKLPRRIQRAIAERRRLRFLEWGITKEDWLKNEWSLWKVPEDPDFMPRRNLEAHKKTIPFTI